MMQYYIIRGSKEMMVVGILTLLSEEVTCQTQ